MTMQIAKAVIIITLMGLLPCASVRSANIPQEQAAQILPQNAYWKTLRDVAHERDVEIESTSCLGEFSDLISLSISSNTIVVGRIIDAQSSFTESGTDISTTYSIEVERLLKSTAPIPVPLDFIGFGGVVYVNGHRAAYNDKKLAGLVKGSRYIFFLEWISRGSYYILSGGLSGLFSIDEKLNVQSFSSDSASELRQKHSCMNVESLINEIMLSK